MISFSDAKRIAHSLGKSRDELAREYDPDSIVVKALDEAVDNLWDDLVKLNPQLRQDNLNTNVSFKYVYSEGGALTYD